MIKNFQTSQDLISINLLLVTTLLFSPDSFHLTDQPLMRDNSKYWKVDTEQKERKKERKDNKYIELACLIILINTQENITSTPRKQNHDTVKYIYVYIKTM